MTTRKLSGNRIIHCGKSSHPNNQPTLIARSIDLLSFDHRLTLERNLSAASNIPHLRAEGRLFSLTIAVNSATRSTIRIRSRVLAYKKAGSTIRLCPVTDNKLLNDSVYLDFRKDRQCRKSFLLAIIANLMIYA